MSGHSKWHNIRVKKTAADARRGKVYTRHARLIEIAAQRGGDPTMNPGLRTAIDNARADDVPMANIERAIKKGSGELQGLKMEEVVYAAMAPNGVACLIECLSDNRNRTLSNVKSIIGKHGGTFTESSSVLWMFARKGLVVARKSDETKRSLEEMELELIDFGAEDLVADEDLLTVTTDVHNWTKIRDFLKEHGWTIERAGLSYVPSQTVALDDHGMEKLANFVQAVEEDEDVAEVFTNAA